MVVVLAARGAQILFAAVTLALSAVLISQYGEGHAPALLAYGAFCGGAALVIGLIGVAATFVDALQGVITLGLDVLATFFLLAGGIAFAATIKVGSCTDDIYLVQNHKTFFPGDDKLARLGDDDKRVKEIQHRCRMTQADTAFLWFTFVFAAAAMALAYKSRKSGLGGSIV